MHDFHYVLNQAHRFGLNHWLSTVEGRVSIANLLHHARCRDRGLIAEHIPVPDLIHLLESQGYRCVYCPCNIIHDFQMDHIIAVANGGSHVLSNVQFLCPACNNSKRTDDRPWRLCVWPTFEDVGKTIMYVRAPQTELRW